MYFGDDINEKPTLDARVLQQLRRDLGDEEGESGTLAMLLGDFKVDAAKLIGDMRKAVAENDARLLQRSAHTLKSNSAMFGAVRLSAMNKNLEEMGRNGTLEGAVEKIAGVEAEFELVKAALPN